MGGDDAPGVPIAAARAVAGEVDVLLVGDPAALAGTGLDVVAADQVIDMGEDPALGVRAKPGASIAVAIDLLARGLVGAVVSAGSTGATLAAALLGLGRVPGVSRPGVAPVLPVGHGVVLVDAGASPDVQPEALVAHARLGGAYAAARGRVSPSVGLLNVGAEPGKGNSLARAAHALLSALPGFAGNVEPAAVLAGAVDVVVTDGFTGNVFLKTVEAMAAGGATGPGGVAGGVAGGRGEVHGGALLLGVDGVVVVAHGAAGEAELAAAIATAAVGARGDVVARLHALL